MSYSSYGWIKGPGMCPLHLWEISYSPVEDAFGMSVSWTQHSESGIPHIYEWILVRCAFTYLIVGVLTHFDRLPQLAFVGKPCFGSFAIGETPGHPRLRDPNHQRVICKFKETSFQRMIGHVQKGTHSIGQLLQQIRNGWGKTRGHSIISFHPSRPLPFAFVGICGLSAAQLWMCPGEESNVALLLWRGHFNHPNKKTTRHNHPIHMCFPGPHQ